MNTFLSSKGSPTVLPKEVIRATEDEKQFQISMLKSLHDTYEEEAKDGIRKVQKAAIHNEKMFEQWMETCKYSSVGEITEDLFEVGGQYRRNM